MAEQDPPKTSRAALALALESEVAPAAACTLSQALEIFRRSPNFSPPQRAAAKMQVARLGWACVTEARKAKGGTAISPTLRDANAASWLAWIPARESSMSSMEGGQKPAAFW
jgi:hypothetical protein